MSSGTNPLDQLARRLASASHSRRATLGALGGGTLAAIAAARANPTLTAAAQATPTAAASTIDLDAATLDNIAQALWMPGASFDQLPATVQDQLSEPRNSNAAFGERMRYYLQNLMDFPDSFTPNYDDQYRLLQQYADSLSPHQSYIYTSLLGMDKTRDFDPIPEKPNLTFPEANGMNLGTQVEWYFAVGSAWDAAGAEYGIEFMLFRYAILPPPIARHFGLSDTDNQVMELQLAITVAGETHYQATPIVVAGTTGLLSFETNAIGATLGNNGFQQLDPDQPFPLQIQGRGWDQQGREPLELGVDITFSSGRDYLLQGTDGCAPCCAGIGTLYYSIPGLVVDPTVSRITIGDQEIELTSGTFWFDHQWGNALGGGNVRSEALRATSILSPSALAGWDWFLAQFDDNRQITVAALHTDENEPFYFQTGATAPGTMVAPVIGKFMDEAGVVHDVSGTLTVDAWVRAEGSPDPALYWPTHTWYPNHWQFDLTEGAPEDLASFSMTPIVPDGQAAFFANGAQYSEGAVVLHNAEGIEVGRGFAESVNYAETRLNQLALAGLPVTMEIGTTLAPVKPGLALEAEAALYAATHQEQIQQELGMCIGIGVE